MASVLLYRKIIRVKEDDIQRLQAIIDMDKEEFIKSGTEASAVLKLYFVTFDNGFKGKVSVISGNKVGEKYSKGYVEALLLNENENPVGEELIGFNLEGQYKFTYSDGVYIIDIIGDY
ncbi:hypothetical protein [Clostridium polynesiense]|uniref:hypothetical protein n=1 Tax=Clostridium polynesiense TaxID=1325933 RepID=UPI00058FAA87|nr:hypothetical protein [Clostridium polynesiense]